MDQVDVLFQEMLGAAALVQVVCKQWCTAKYLGTASVSPIAATALLAAKQLIVVLGLGAHLCCQPGQKFHKI